MKARRMIRRLKATTDPLRKSQLVEGYWRDAPFEGSITLLQYIFKEFKRREDRVPDIYINGQKSPRSLMGLDKQLSRGDRLFLQSIGFQIAEAVAKYDLQFFYDFAAALKDFKNRPKPDELLIAMNGFDPPFVPYDTFTVKDIVDYLKHVGFVDEHTEPKTLDKAIRRNAVLLGWKIKGAPGRPRNRDKNE